MNPLIKSVSIINGFGGKVKRQNSRKMSTFAKAAAGDKKRTLPANAGSENSIETECLRLCAVQFADQIALFAGCGVLVQQILGSGLVDLLAGKLHSLGLVLSVGINSGICLLDGGLEGGVAGLVVGGLYSVDLDSLFSRLNVGHGFHSFSGGLGRRA